MNLDIQLHRVLSENFAHVLKYECLIFEKIEFCVYISYTK